MSAQAVLQELVRHNTWANRWLIAFCEKLDPVALEWTTPGTYGSIHTTIQHTVLAEEGYVWRLKEKGPRPAADPTLLSLTELDRRAQAVGDELVSYLSHDWDPLGSREGQSPEGVVFAIQADVFVLQYLHHGNEHRAHVCTILGAHGVEPPEVSVWEFADQTGKIRRV